MGEYLDDWVADNLDMHDQYGFQRATDKQDLETLKKHYQFRLSMIAEEYDELNKAKTAEDAVDAIIDLCVFAIGTLNLFGVDANAAWNEVHRANMSKGVGIKEGRPNPLGLPDLIKPPGWRGPDYSGIQLGKMPEIMG